MRVPPTDVSAVILARRPTAIACVLWLSSLAAFGLPDESGMDGAIAKLRAVGPEGRGNLEAQRAWRQLVRSATAREIPRLLRELDGANELAANWIRGAIGTIAERDLARGGKLPAARLEEFVRTESHPARARRLAFEWLTRVDSTARKRLIPGMLRDPGVEFRRDAVEYWWAQAEAGNEENEKAIATYRRLLDAARDNDQVNRIRRRLRALGVEVDLRRHFGYVTAWKLIGPFDNTGEHGLERSYPPEEEVDFRARYAGKSGEIGWIDHETTDDYGKVDLNRALGRAKGVLAYAHHEFWSERERDAEIRLSTVNAWKLWLNGELLYTRDEYHHGTQFDHYRVEARLRRGRNEILLKICQNELRERYADPWKFRLRVCDATGTAILSTRRGSSGEERSGEGSPKSRGERDGERKRRGDG